MTQAPKFSILPTAFATIILLVVCLLRTVPLPALDAPSFRNVTNMTFTASLSGRRLSLADQSDIQHFVAAIRLTHKDRCLCAHTLTAVFERSSGERVRVYFCDHCFDVAGEKRTRYYKMPKQFYAEFSALVRSQPQPWELH